MNGTRVSFILAVILGLLTAVSCGNDKPADSETGLPQFSEKDLSIGPDLATRKIRGQVLYLPVYSNVPYHEDKSDYDLSAFVAVHNADLSNPIRIRKVLFFDNGGRLVKSYVDREITLDPLAATRFFVPEDDKSGTGANFLVEWVSDTAVTVPLVESVMIGLKNSQGVSFTSVGRVVREMK